MKFRKFLASGGDTRVPAKSVFARQFYVALKQKHKNSGLLSYNKLVVFLEKIESPRIKTRDFGDGSDGDFTFVRKNACVEEVVPKDAELVMWEVTSKQHNIEAYQYYLETYKDGQFKSQAQSAIRSLREERAWENAKRSHTPVAYHIYLETYPAGKHIAEATTALEKLRDIVEKDPGNFVFIPGGTFIMGSEDGGPDEKPIHNVTLHDFYIAATEVTNEQFCAFLNEKGKQISDVETWINLAGSFRNEACRIKRNGERYEVEAGYGQYPVIYVSWDGAKAYCNWLGSQYRLPTEAEWEYAAGGGLRNRGTKFSGSQILSEVGWFEGNSNLKIHPVGLKRNNELGLYDMSGNVAEWCNDWYGKYPDATQVDPGGPASGSDHVYRGGSWSLNESIARITFRHHVPPNYMLNQLGFRPVKTRP
jgi:formylglycine-generating enzyme required for sulfatase activity